MKALKMINEAIEAIEARIEELEVMGKVNELMEAAQPGRLFVKIFEMRKIMTEGLDELLVKAAEMDLICLNMGNPGKLTRDEVASSYRDQYGDLYITISRR